MLVIYPTPGTHSLTVTNFIFARSDDRRDHDFGHLHSFPFLDGNIPKGQSYGVFISQLVRYARVNCSFDRFISNCKDLVDKLINQHFDAAALRRRFQVFIDRHFDIWGKFGIPLRMEHVF